MRKKVSFLLILFLISLFGFFLRVVDYDHIPPFADTQDEFFYPWAGMTLLQSGKPTAWAWFDSYKEREIVVYWGATYPLVTPWVEKPPLYSLLQGITVLLFGDKQLSDVRLSQIRTIPVALSFFTIFLVGLLARELFNKHIALLAAVFYATVPTIVLANRYSLVENLMTPLFLAGSYLFVKKANIFLIGLFCALAVLTKNIGIILPGVFLLILAFEKKWREAIVLTAISGVAFLIHPLMGVYYGWNLFVSVLQDYQKTFAGLPQLVQTIFINPTIASKEISFPDGAMLAGYILLFSAPFWLTHEHFKTGKLGQHVLLAIPLAYLVLLSFFASGGGPFSFYGWHVFPLFPYLTILLAVILYDVYHNPSILKFLVIFLVIGESSIRFLLTVLTPFASKWQYMTILVLAAFCFASYPKTKTYKPILLALFIMHVLINILTVANMELFYRSFPQPIN